MALFFQRIQFAFTVFTLCAISFLVAPSSALSHPLQVQKVVKIPIQKVVKTPIQGVVKTPTLDLTADTSLNRLVTLQEVAIPLNELLHKISNKEVTFSASPSCQDWKLHLRLKEKPLRSLMQAIAQLLPGSWTAQEKGHGYVLEMSEKAMRRRDDWWQLFFRERDKALKVQKAYVLSQMRGEKDKAGVQGGFTPEHQASEETDHNFFRMLPAALQARVADQMNENPYYGLQGRGIGTGNDEGATVVSMSELPQTVQTEVRKYLTDKLGKIPDKLDWDNVYINITNGGSAVLADVVLPDGPFLGTSFSSGFQIIANQVVLTLDHSLLVYCVQKMGKKAPVGWHELAAYHQSSVWKNTPPVKPRDLLRLPYRADVLNWLGEKADMEFISDYYARPERRMQEVEKAAPLTRPLTQELNDFAFEQDTSWKLRPDNIYLFRNNRWYRDDRLEVLTPLLKHWVTLKLPFEQDFQPNFTQSKGTLTEHLKQWMDRYAEFVTDLTPWQVATGLCFYCMEEETNNRKAFNPALKAEMQGAVSSGLVTPGEGHPFWADANYILENYSTVRFYASLEPSARIAVLENRLLFSFLSLDQQKQALALLPRLQVLLRRQNKPEIILGLRPVTDGRKVVRGAVAGRLWIIPPPPAQ